MTEATQNIDLGSNLGEPTPKRAPRAKAAAPAATVGMPETVSIILEENDDIPPTGLFIGHNGIGYLLRCNERISVPKHVLNVLDDAVMSMPRMDPQSQQVIGYNERRRYPYKVVQ